MSDVNYVISMFTKKPWGAEYLVCSTPSSALWCLSIEPGSSTSFHCHPRKRTGYVVLSGEVSIEFLSSTKALVPGDFINLRPGLFHKTTALAPATIILEVESPNLKEDILRLEDVAGRKSSVMEVPETTNNRRQLFLSEVFESVFQEKSSAIFLEQKLSLITITKLEDIISNKTEHSFLLVLEGTVQTNSSYTSSESQRLLGPGDVISIKNIARMRHVIDLSNLSLMGVLFERLP